MNELEKAEAQKSIIGYAEPLKPAVGTLTVGEAADFWTKHKNKAWVAILLVVGALGGNIDELYKMIPDVYDVQGLRKDVQQLRVDVDSLRGVPSITKPSTSDDGFKVERPSK